jgi:hypothetical protein
MQKKFKSAIVAGIGILLLLMSVRSGFAAASCFTDTAGHWAESFICWLQGAGITSGYPDGSYRPNNSVTRAEMAVFLQQVAGAGSVGPVADADLLDGLQANQLVRASYAENSTSINDFSSTTFATLLSTSVTAPANGILMIWGNVNVEWDVDSTANSFGDLHTQLTLDGTPVSIELIHEFADVPNGENSGESIAISAAVVVSSGNRTVAIEGKRDGDSIFFVMERSLTTLFVPFGNAGAQGILSPQLLGASSAISSNN